MTKGKLRSSAHDALLQTMDGSTARKKFESVLSKGDRSHFRSEAPNPLDLKQPKVAAVADDSQGESSRQASQRPLAWTYMEDDDP